MKRIISLVAILSIICLPMAEAGRRGHRKGGSRCSGGACQRVSACANGACSKATVKDCGKAVCECNPCLCSPNCPCNQKKTVKQ